MKYHHIFSKLDGWLLDMFFNLNFENQRRLIWLRKICIWLASVGTSQKKSSFYVMQSDSAYKKRITFSLMWSKLVHLLRKRRHSDAENIHLSCTILPCWLSKFYFCWNFISLCIPETRFFCRPWPGLIWNLNTTSWIVQGWIGPSKWCRNK